MGSEPFTAETTQVSEPHKVGLNIGLNFSISIYDRLNLFEFMRKGKQNLTDGQKKRGFASLKKYNEKRKRDVFSLIICMITDRFPEMKETVRYHQN